MSRTKTILSISLASLLGISCGGGGGGSTNLAGGGIGGTGITAAGTITGFGSIFVNSLRFDISSAAINTDGVSATEGGLKLGMVVTVSGALNEDGKTAVASLVQFDDEVEGPIKVVNAAAGLLDVLGQRVRVDSATVIETSDGGALTFKALTGGNVVEVSGFKNSQGEILATRVELRQDSFVPGTSLEVTGGISSVNFGNMTFKVNDLEVDFSLAQLNDINGGTLNNGDVVEVKGTNLTGGGALIADLVEGTGNLADQGNDEVEVEGFVTQLSGGQFKVGGQPVRISATTKFKNGTSADIDLDAILEVEGRLGADGVLNAAEVKIKDAPGGDISADTGHDGETGDADDDVDGEDGGNDTGNAGEDQNGDEGDDGGDAADTGGSGDEATSGDDGGDAADSGGSGGGDDGGSADSGGSGGGDDGGSSSDGGGGGDSG